MTTAVEKLPKSTIKITVTLAWSEIKDTYDKIIADLIKDSELPGFRKGKAPKKLIEEKMDKTKVYEEVIKQVVPKAYADAVKENNLNPIISPRINILQASENKDWQFTALTCTQPSVNLRNYKDEVNKLKHTPKIWIPGKDNKKEEKDDKKGIELSQILQLLLKEVDIEVPELLIEDQVNRKLSDLVDQVKQAGLTVEKYLLSKGITIDQLKNQYWKESEETIKLEFILEAISDKENIQVSDDEINAAITKIEDKNQQEALKNQKYYIATLLRRQKTLDSLIKPIV
jgi:FKBP-type peptidyl-prolyl cis-trans isomerase (trigger factor)